MSDLPNQVARQERVELQADKPEAIFLAETLEMLRNNTHATPDGVPLHLAAAAELRRLHAECEALRTTLDAVIGAARKGEA